MRLVTMPGVFRPRSDSWMLARAVSARASASVFALDLFTGSGVVAIAAALAGAGQVTAVDVSRRAVASAVLGGRLNGISLRGVRGDMFAAVPGERFDLISANPPYVPGGAIPSRGASRAWEGGNDGRAFLHRLLREAPERLLPGGSLLIVQSSVAGIEATIEALNDGGLTVDVVDRRRGPLGPLVRARTRELERQGLLAPGQSDEEIVVIEGRRSRGGLGAKRVHETREAPNPSRAKRSA